MSRLEIRRITAHERVLIRAAVRRAMALWPNAHLGDQTRREDMREAFRMLRAHSEGGRVELGASAVERDTDRYEDM